MSSLKEMVGIKNKVKYLLQHYRHLRDDDNKLIANIWHSQLNEKISSDEFLKLFSGGFFTSPESIRRMRQKLQQNYPDLRGSLYNKRKKLQIEITKTITKI